MDTLTLTPDGAGSGLVEAVKFVVNDEEYEATKNNSWTVKNVVIEEDAKIKVTVDLAADDSTNSLEWTSFSIKVNNWSSALSKSTLANVEYDDVSWVAKTTANSNLVGSISISSVKIQAAKWSLTNDATKKVEFKVKETTEQVVFNGKYTAKNNGNVNLDNVKIWRVANNGTNAAANEAVLTWALKDSDVTFTIEIDGKSVATIDNPATATSANNAKDDADFSAISIKAWESVSVKILANIYAATWTTTVDWTGGNLEYKVQLSWKDDSWNDAGFASKDLAPISFVDNSSISVTTNAAMKLQDVVLANKNQNLATFIVKPTNKSTTANLDSLEFTIDSNLSWLITTTDADDYFEVKIGNETADNLSLDGTTLTVSDLNIDITENTQVTVTFKEKLTAADPTDDDSAYVLTLNNVNGKSWTTYTFKRTAVNSLVRVSSMAWNKDAETKYRFDIEYADDAIAETISGVTFTYEKGLPAWSDEVSGTGTHKTWSNVQADKNYTVDNWTTANYVTEISWTDGDGKTVTLSYAKNNDFFKTNGTNEDRLRAYAND